MVKTGIISLNFACTPVFTIGEYGDCTHLILDCKSSDHSSSPNPLFGDLCRLHSGDFCATSKCVIITPTDL